MSTAIGRMAEDAAAAYLRQQGYAIAAQNWRTRWCEIDVIAIKDEVVYFFEVKYRASAAWGSGLDYITPRKLQQMQFAAQMWCARHTAADCRLSAIELTGNPPRITRIVECDG